MILADSLDWTSSLQVFLTLRTLGIYLSTRFYNKVLKSSPFFYLIHIAMYGSHPSSSRSKKIIPALETVAGDAAPKSWTSNNSLTYGVRATLSPLVWVRSLLSSSTEFIDSIQRVSTGPSRIIHLISVFSKQIFLRVYDKIPSIHYGGSWSSKYP